MFIKFFLSLLNRNYTIRRLNMGTFGKFHGFYGNLEKDIRSHRGKYKKLVKYCPPFFQLLCKILNDKVTDWNTKLMIDAALAYFVLPDDIIPDKEEAGYVDDLFIVTHVLREIKDKVSPELITNNWEEKEDILLLIDKIYDESSKIVAQYSLDIIHKVGLHKYQSLNLAEYSGTYPQRMARLGNEKRELLGLIAYLIKQLYKVNAKGWTVENIKALLQEYGDYDEICRLIELSKMNHEYVPINKKANDKKTISSEPDIKTRLKAARIKALLEENSV